MGDDEDDGVDVFAPCTLGRAQDGDPKIFFKKMNGAGANDMTMMATLTVESILNNLNDRFVKEIVYTWVGDICISVNPFKNVGCVGKTIRAKYKKAGGPNARAQFPPHCYTLVDSTFSQMLTESKSQSILISGESGAGKTEAMKIALTYIGEIAKADAKKAGEGDIAVKLMQTNPIMEAIGNAKTVRNNNSSRFGKHFDLQFKEGGFILGAFTSTYLLEKPRICEHMKGERNYHVFYMVCKASEDIREPCEVEAWEGYKINKQDGTIAVVTTWDDNAEFKDMHKAFLLLGFSEVQRNELYTLLSFSMSCGNIDFEENDKMEAKVKGTEEIEKSARLIQVTEDQLAKVLTSKTMGGGVIEFFSSPLDKKKAGLSRNSLVMHIYCLVFDWCVDIVNDYIAVKECDYAIGVLDIFGFENFVLNSFPQLCINFTNESLHNLFIEHVFKLEQETYIREEVQWNFVEYEDNQPTLDLINKRPVCILGLLDEGCATGSATDATVILNFHGAFKDPKKHKAYKTPKKSPDKCFCIIHYAGEVVYTIDGFVEKNKDELSSDTLELLNTETGMESLKMLAIRDEEKKKDTDDAGAAAKKKGGGGGKKKKTVGRTFGDSLRALMEKLGKTQHHYIRCLKPNQTLQAGDWVTDFMYKQLAYSGTLEVTEIRKAGLNVRRPLQQFFRYYKLCADDQDGLRAGTVTKRCELLLTQCEIDPNKWRVGKTLVFLKEYEILDELDKLREVKMVDWVILLQSYGRMAPKMQRFRYVRRKAMFIQRLHKTKECKAALDEIKEAAVVIQRYGRGYAWRKQMIKAKAVDGFDPNNQPATMEGVIKIMDIIRPAGRMPKYKPKAGGPGGRARAGAGAKKAAGPGAGSMDPLPRMRAKHKGWLQMTLDTEAEGAGGPQLLYTQMRNGVFTIYGDETLKVVHDTFPLMDCKMDATANQIVLSQPRPMQISLKKGEKKPALPEGEAPPAVEEGERHTCTIAPDAGKAGEAGLAPGDVIKQWTGILEQAIAESVEMDDFLIDPDGSSDPVEKLVVMKEGMLHSKVVKHDILSGDDHKQAAVWGQIQWGYHYFALYNNGRIHVYTSEEKETQVGIINLRLFGLEESEEEFDDDDAEGAEKKEKKGPPGEEMAVGDDFYMVVKGKTFELLSGSTIIRLGHANAQLVDDWLDILRNTGTTMYQKSPIFVQQLLPVKVLTKKDAVQLPLEETTRVSACITKICKELKVTNSSQWAFYESWDAIDIPGTHGMRKRRCTAKERVLDELMLSWEIATRKRYGMVAGLDDDAFKLTLMKATSLKPQATTKDETLLEYAQAVADVTSGRFVPETEQELFDLCALAWFKELMEGEQEEGAPPLASTDVSMSATTMAGNELKYLPASWESRKEAEAATWATTVATNFTQCLHEELVHTDEMSKTRELIADARMIDDPTGMSVAEIYIDRVRRSPLCFAETFRADLWAAERTYGLQLMINYTGISLFTQDKEPTFISSFGYTDAIISWLTTDENMLTVYLVHKSAKKAAKLHFVTQEANDISSLLTQYSAEVLTEQKKLDREAANRKRAAEKLLENQLTA